MDTHTDGNTNVQNSKCYSSIFVITSIRAEFVVLQLFFFPAGMLPCDVKFYDNNCLYFIQCNYR